MTSAGYDKAALAEAIAEERETYDKGGQIACPVCHREFGDLFEIGGGDEGEHEIECPICYAPITLARNIEVTYAATARAPESEEQKR